ncbi:MAG: ABC transporter substrate-binding protein, partial [Variibacter sp.]
MKRVFTALFAAALLALPASGATAATKMTIATGVDPSFSAFYIAKTAGFFEKNGLDVQINTGPSGSAMVAFVIQNQVQAAFGAEQAGVQNFNIDNNVVVVAEGALMTHWYGMVARNVENVAALKGKKIGVARGSGSEVFWLAMVEKLKLNPKDYTIVQVEAPEMVAALERGNIDAFTSWEPWLTRAVMAVPNSKIIQTAQGIMSPRVYVYLNKGWADKNPEAAVAFVRSLDQATKFINSNREEAATQVSNFLKLD